MLYQLIILLLELQQHLPLESTSVVLAMATVLQQPPLRVVVHYLQVCQQGSLNSMLLCLTKQPKSIYQWDLKNKVKSIQSVTGITTVVFTVGVTNTGGPVGVASTTYVRGVFTQHWIRNASSLYIYPGGTARPKQLDMVS